MLGHGRSQERSAYCTVPAILGKWPETGVGGSDMPILARSGSVSPREPGVREPE